MVTVITAAALAVIGAILAWPIDSLLSALAPFESVLKSVGLGLDQQTGFLCLFLSPAPCAG